MKLHLSQDEDEQWVVRAEKQINGRKYHQFGRVGGKGRNKKDVEVDIRETATNLITGLPKVVG